MKGRETEKKRERIRIIKRNDRLETMCYCRCCATSPPTLLLWEFQPNCKSLLCAISTIRQLNLLRSINIVRWFITRKEKETRNTRIKIFVKRSIRVFLFFFFFRVIGKIQSRKRERAYEREKERGREKEWYTSSQRILINEYRNYNRNFVSIVSNVWKYRETKMMIVIVTP